MVNKLINNPFVLSYVFINGGAAMSHGSNDGVNIIYLFPWPSILVLFIAITALLWLIKYIIREKNIRAKK